MYDSVILQLFHSKSLATFDLKKKAFRAYHLTASHCRNGIAFNPSHSVRISHLTDEKTEAQRE